VAAFNAIIAPLPASGGGGGAAGLLDLPAPPASLPPALDEWLSTAKLQLISLPPAALAALARFLSLRTASGTDMDGAAAADGSRGASGLLADVAESRQRLRLLLQEVQQALLRGSPGNRGGMRGKPVCWLAR
jgi:hypothetical protein